jgi:hypothetical protein
MTGPIEYELTGTDQLDLYEGYLTELKELEIHGAALSLAKMLLKKLAGDADYITVDGVRVLQVIRTRPHRFDANEFKRYDPRLYERFVKQADAETVSLRVVGHK